MDEKLLQLKEQTAKINDLKNHIHWGTEYQLWVNKTEKLVKEIFGQEALQLFQKQRTTTTSYIDDSFNTHQYLKELDNRKTILDSLLEDITEYKPKSKPNQTAELNAIKEVWRKEQALKENLLLTEEAQSIQNSLIQNMEKILPKDSIPGLRFRKLLTDRSLQSWWTSTNGYPTENPWTKIQPLIDILQQHEAEKTIKHRFETQGLFVESRAQGEDQHLLIGKTSEGGDKAHVIIDGKTGEIRIEDNQKEPTDIMSRIETILTLPNGKKIKTTREAIEEMA